jgi:hypothetical protein
LPRQSRSPFPRAIPSIRRLGRAAALGTEDRRAGAIASPRSQWVTAQTLFVNGGYLAR